MTTQAERPQHLPAERRSEGAEVNTSKRSPQDTTILTHLATACDGLRHLSYTVAEEEHGPSARELWRGYRRGLQLIDAIIQVKRTPVACDGESEAAL